MNADMVKKWIAKAENDLKTGKDERATPEPATDTICFHMQQCAEKYLKAYLICQGKEISKTHNLTLLIRLCMELDSEFQTLLDVNADDLTDYAVDTRYPDDFYLPDLNETDNAVYLAEYVKAFILRKLIISD